MLGFVTPTGGSPMRVAGREAMALPRPAARGAALHLFHDLTSRLELAAVELRGEGGTEWPRHRFFFGHVEDIVSALRARPDALPVTSPPPAGTAAPATLFIEGADAGFTAVLVACADSALLDAIGRDT